MRVCKSKTLGSVSFTALDLEVCRKCADVAHCSSGACSESSSSDACVGGLCLPQPFHVQRKLDEEGSDPTSSFFLKSLQRFNLGPFHPDD